MSIKKYRNKPVVREALYFDGANVDEVKAFVGAHNLIVKNFSGGQVFINTLEGHMKLSFGDYIIKGTVREFYPCKGDAFKNTYEEIDAELSPEDLEKNKSGAV